ncbi:MAG: asparagine synthase (glutamine-hydrolyzing) [Gammaproteobacteria bacterium]
MCGLVFLYSEAQASDELRGRVASALQRIAHRGPDDEGIVVQAKAAIGHRRLAIIDLEASRQPMTDPENRFVLAYNGEIYNYLELRHSLQSRWHFKTRGDTEVVFAGLILEGELFLRKMEGMWALAFWDDSEKSLLLSRDRMGKKPLYYSAQSMEFVCASELPALKDLSSTPLEEDLDSTADYLRYGYTLPGTTAYRNIFEVLPGHVLRWSAGRQVESRPYWSLSLEAYSGSLVEAAENLREAFTDAVKKRLVADVEVAAFLSGGVDSSLVTGVMKKICRVSPKTFTIGFREASYDERPFARRVSSFLGTEHFEECLTDWDADLLKRFILDKIGQPFSDSSLLPTSLVSELASRHVKVALSGDGGDELFSGYQRYQARAILRWYTRLPMFVRKNISRVIKAIPEPMAHHSRSLLKKAYLFQDIVDRMDDEQPYVAPLLYSRAIFKQLAPELAGRGHAPPALPERARLDDIFSMMVGDALVYLPQDILVKVDRASMAHSLEARAPFLDRRVVELAFSLPRTWHRRGFSGKRLLQKAFPDLLPKEIWRRRKQGFGVPIHHWFRAALGEELQGLLKRHDAPINTDFVLNLLTLHRRKIRDHGYQLWNIYIYLLWKEANQSAY